MITFPIAILSMEDNDDKQFMEWLYVKYHRVMYAHAYKVCRRTECLDDIVSEACIALIRKISVIRQLECHALTSYIVSTVKNKAIDFVRNDDSKYMMESDDAIQHIPSGEPETDSRLLKQETIDELAAAIGMLSERDKELLRLKYINNMSNAEIAKALKVKAISVGSMLMRARQRAYEKLKEVSGDE